MPQCSIEKATRGDGGKGIDRWSLQMIWHDGTFDSKGYVR